MSVFDLYFLKVLWFYLGILGIYVVFFLLLVFTYREVEN